MLRSIRAGLRALLRRDAVRQDVDDELAHFLALATEERERAGVPPAEAARQARVEMRGLTAARETVLTSGWESRVDAARRDVRFALRRLRRQPALTAVAALTLALGLGATTTMAAVVAAVDLRALPFADAHRLVVPHVVEACATPGCPVNPRATVAQLDRWRAHATSYSALGAVMPTWFWWMRDGEEDGAGALEVTPGFLGLLGRRPVLGRDFVDADTVAGAEPVVILGDSLWRAAFGGDRGIVGRRIELDPADDGARRFATVVGVLPPGVRFWSEAAWRPAVRAPEGDRDVPMQFPVARLKPGVTAGQAAAELALLASSEASGSGNEPGRLVARAPGLRETYVDVYEIGRRRFLLLGIAAAVLLIAAVNVASLLLTRVAARRAEFAMLMALGARRAPLARQIVIEALVPTLVAGALGALIARWAVDAQSRYLGLVDIGMPAPVDARLLGACALVAVALGLGVGAAAALGGLPEPGERALRDTVAGGEAATRRRWIADGLVLLQIAAAFVLVTGAALLTLELTRLTNEAPGYDPRGLHLVLVAMPDSVHADTAQRRLFAATARARIAAVPGVAGAALGPTQFTRSDLRVAGQDAPLPRAAQPLQMSVDEHYFPLFGAGPVQGRLFTAADDVGAAPVAVVNETAARRLWPDRLPVGRRLFFGTDSGGTWATIVGVVPDAKVANAGLRGEKPIVYRPFDQAPLGARLFVRVRGDSAAAVAAIRAALRDLTGRPTNRQLDVEPMAAGIRTQTAELRFTTRSLVAFALFGLLLAALGLFATVAATVTRRTREIGIRMALGAMSRHVLALVMGRTVRLAVLGVVVGVGASVAATRLLRSMLTMTSPTHPGVFAGAAAVLIGAVVAASYLPARRATRIAPVDAMRVE